MELLSWLITIVMASPLPSPDGIGGRDKPTRAAFPRQEALKVRVRVAEASGSFVLRGYDLKIYQNLSGPERKLVFESDRFSQWNFACNAGKILARRDGASGAPLPMKSPTQIESPAGFVSVGERPYRERIWVRAKPNGCEIVNEVDIEKYLDGLVNAEFSANWSEEAIAAQVVAARTYAYYQMRKLGASRDFDVDATVKDQVYDGSYREDYRATRGVNRTRGVVLVESSGNPMPLKAFYHSTCGGQTELPERVWGKSFPGFRRKVSCPYCSASPRFKWDVQANEAEIRSAILRAGLADEKLRKVWYKDWRALLSWGSIKAIRVIAAPHDPRSAGIKVWVQWKKASAWIALPSTSFRDAIGPTRLRSTWFDVKKTGPESWAFEGRGNGHGVGLCQWGAKVMGEKGIKALAILQHYYPDAVLKKMW